MPKSIDRKLDNCVLSIHLPGKEQNTVNRKLKEINQRAKREIQELAQGQFEAALLDLKKERINLNHQDLDWAMKKAAIRMVREHGRLKVEDLMKETENYFLGDAAVVNAPMTDCGMEEEIRTERDTAQQIEQESNVKNPSAETEEPESIFELGESLVGSEAVLEDPSAFDRELDQYINGQAATSSSDETQPQQQQAPGTSSLVFHNSHTLNTNNSTPINNRKRDIDEIVSPITHQNTTQSDTSTNINSNRDIKKARRIQHQDDTELTQQNNTTTHNSGIINLHQISDRSNWES